jgi:hypothetical protein
MVTQIFQRAVSLGSNIVGIVGTFRHFESRQLGFRRLFTAAPSLGAPSFRLRHLVVFLAVRMSASSFSILSSLKLQRCSTSLRPFSDLSALGPMLQFMLSEAQP